MGDVIIRELPGKDISRAREVDRSEHVTTGYVFRNGKLETQVVDWQVPRWSDDASSGFSAQSRIEGWGAVLDRGGVLLGALDGEKLAGFAVILPELSEGMAQLAALFVDRDYRRQGVATRLVEEAERLARVMREQGGYMCRRYLPGPRWVSISGTASVRPLKSTRSFSRWSRMTYT